MTKSYKAVDTLAPPNQNPGYATVPIRSNVYSLLMNVCKSCNHVLSSIVVSDRISSVATLETIAVGCAPFLDSSAFTVFQLGIFLRALRPARTALRPARLSSALSELFKKTKK